MSFSTSLLVVVILATVSVTLLICMLWSLWRGHRVIQKVLTLFLLGLALLLIYHRRVAMYYLRTSRALGYHFATEQFMDREQFSHVCRTVFFDAAPHRVWVVHGRWPRRPVLFLVNYPREFIEYFYWGMLPVESAAPVTVMGGCPLDGGIKLRFLRCVFRDGENYIERKGERSFERTKEQIRHEICDKAHSVWAYPERNEKRCPRVAGTINELRTGLFHIAQQLDVPLVPVVCGYLQSGRGQQLIRCVIGPEIPNDQDRDEARVDCRRWMQSVLEWTILQK